MPIPPRNILKTLVVTSTPAEYPWDEWLDVASSYDEAVDLINTQSYGLICAEAALSTDNSSAARLCRYIRKQGLHTRFYEMRSDYKTADARIIMHFGGDGVVDRGLKTVFAMACGMTTF
ncbi:hypothetical protein [Chitinibacter sp. GC72]|uniref:hypothetical protein n=1 Tax=Chitinibacter sp. GC72 TaxID=1526917 RepID=UPI0012FBC790|nr:hypothetical protein [Chitinibacter sp. GC72]